jgi:hypothetical protein
MAGLPAAGLQYTVGDDSDDPDAADAAADTAAPDMGQVRGGVELWRGVGVGGLGSVGWGE